MSQENVELVRRSFQAWNRGDVDAWLESAHAEVEWSSAIARRMEGDAKLYRGRAQMRQFWDEWHSVWDLSINLSEFRDLGEIVVALGSMRAHGKASGIDIEGPVAYVFELEGGLGRRVRAYLDHAEALEAAGVTD